MDYKKIIPNQDLRIKILSLAKNIPDKIMIKFQYWIKTGRKLNFKAPKRFTEKIQWYKLNYRNPLMTQCADKYEVREYIKSKGLERILIKLYASYEDEEEINFDELPEKFIMKTTDGSSTNIICDNKTQLKTDQIKELLNNWIKRDNYALGREWAYKDITPKIIVEELLEDKNTPFKGINDYKFFCFNGKVEYIALDVNRNIDHKRNIYDRDWNYINVSTDYPNIDKIIPKPDGLDEMLEIAEILSEDFPFVRVDLYWVNGKVYFGELTFYPWTGYVQFKPDRFDFILGEKFELPKKYTEDAMI